MSFPFPTFTAQRLVQCDAIGFTQDQSDQTNYTFTGVNIGGPGLIVVVAHGGGGTRTLSSLTIGGVAANIIAATNGSLNPCAVIAWLRVASGTTADIVVGWSGGQNRCAIEVYRITGNLSDAPAAATQQQSSATTALSINLAIPAGGAAVVGASHVSSGAFTWTNLTADYDVTVDTSGNTQCSGGHFSKYNGVTPLAITAAATSSAMSLSGASWS